MDTQRSRSALRGRRILIVEDSALLALELEMVLRSKGCIPLGPARSVSEALALLPAERPDAAVLDLNLKGASALPVAKALSAQEVPFVIVTGYSRMLVQDPVLERAPHLNKPVDHGLLVATLTRLLRERGPSDEPPPQR